MADDTTIHALSVPQKELDAVRAKTAQTMLNITSRTVEALDKLSLRLDGIDDAIANAVNLDEMTFTELNAYFNQCKESFRLRQEFMRVLNGYDVDTSKVAVEMDDSKAETVFTEEDAERIRAELDKRNG